MVDIIREEFVNYKTDGIDLRSDHAPKLRVRATGTEDHTTEVGPTLAINELGVRYKRSQSVPSRSLITIPIAKELVIALNHFIKENEKDD